MINTDNEREFANSIGWAHGRGEELRLHLHNMADDIDRLTAALKKIAAWNDEWGPFPEANNQAWGAMAIVIAREAVPQIPG